MEFKHKSVLLQETIDNLNIRPDGIYVDGTLGGGGHSYEIASGFHPKEDSSGIDQDEAGKLQQPVTVKAVCRQSHHCTE